MVIAAIFAGGIGSRMGNSDTPKQYLELGTKPVIIHTIEKFFINDKIDEILVLCPKAWVAHTRDLVAKHLPDGKKITVIAGGFFDVGVGTGRKFYFARIVNVERGARKRFANTFKRARRR